MPGAGPFLERGQIQGASIWNCFPQGGVLTYALTSGQSTQFALSTLTQQQLLHAPGANRLQLAIAFTNVHGTATTPMNISIIAMQGVLPQTSNAGLWNAANIVWAAFTGTITFTLASNQTASQLIAAPLTMAPANGLWGSYFGWSALQISNTGTATGTVTGSIGFFDFWKQVLNG
jgi:hypothetical protein